MSEPEHPRIRAVAELLALAIVRYHLRRRRRAAGRETAACDRASPPSSSDAATAVRSDR